MSAAPAWSPSWGVFRRRVGLNAALTFAGFAILTMSVDAARGFSPLLQIFMPFVLTLILMLDDFLKWRRVRSESWQIEDGHLMHEGPDGRAMIPLSEIDRVTGRFGHVVIRLTSGQHITMRYLPGPDGVMTQLDAARPT
jgi:hypothetical protein